MKQPLIVYQHSVLCQTSMPYRDPGDNVRRWERENGMVSMEIEAGRILDPVTHQFTNVGLPYGAKPRLLLMHLNAQALRTQKPVIDLGKSLRRFVEMVLGLDSGGKTLHATVNQFCRLAAARFRFGMVANDRAVTVNSNVLLGIELWARSQHADKFVWPGQVQFSNDYFASLMEHAVPLSQEAIQQLAQSPMALDIYSWLAQRLYRIPSGTPSAIRWTSLWRQFGAGYVRIRDFRRSFRSHLEMVNTVYPAARFSVDDRGIRLVKSDPPINPRTLICT